MITNDGQESALESGDNKEYPVWVSGIKVWLRLDQMTLFQRRLTKKNQTNNETKEGNKK